MGETVDVLVVGMCHLPTSAMPAYLPFMQAEIMVLGSGQVVFPPLCAPSSMIVASQTMMSRSK